MPQSRDSYALFREGESVEEKVSSSEVWLQPFLECQVTKCKYLKHNKML